MPLKAVIQTLCTALGLTLVSACGQTQALRPPPPALIDLRPDLLSACEAIATPSFDALPALAPDGSESRRVQLEERAFWMEFVLAMDGVSARQCARYLELRDLVVGYNDAARAMQNTWPR